MGDTIDNQNLLLHWESIGLIIKIRRRRKRGRNSNRIRKTRIIKNNYNIPRVFYNNACSLNEEKLEILSCIKSQYDIIAITETWSNEDTNMKLDNFNLYEKIRKNKIGGGAALFVWDNIQTTTFNNFIHNNSGEFDIIWCVLRPHYLPKSISVIAVACVYMPPNLSKQTEYKLFESLCNAYENISKKYVSPGFLICGDFNKWNFINNFLSATKLIQTIKFPTFHDNGKKYKSKLDLVFTNLNEWYNTPIELNPLKFTKRFHSGIELTPLHHSLSINVQRNGYSIDVIQMII